MNRKIRTTIEIAFALLALSACNLVDVVNQVVPSDTPTEVNYSDRAVGVEGAPPFVSVGCEGATCPTPPVATYACVSGQPESAIVEGAGSVICP